MIKKLYRIKCVEVQDKGVSLKTISYDVVRETEKSYFIKYRLKEKRVSKKGRALFAHATIKKAKTHYYYRVQSYMYHLEQALKKARAGFALIQKELEYNGNADN